MAWQPRYVWVEGQAQGKVVYLIERTADDPNSWWAVAPDGDFGTVNLRQWRFVRREPDGVHEYDDCGAPSEDDKGAILAAFQEWRAAQPDADGAAGGVAAPPGLAPGPVRRGAAAGGDGGGGVGAFVPLPLAAGNANARRGALGATQGGGAGRPRRSWRGQAWRRTREAGAARVSAGVLFSSGGLWKLWISSEAFFARAKEFMQKHERAYKKFKDLDTAMGGAGQKIGSALSMMLSCITWGIENWGMMILLSLGFYILWGLFSGPSGAAYQVGRFREEERYRDAEEAAERRMQHEEMMSELRAQRNQAQASSSSGLAGSLQQGVNAHSAGLGGGQGATTFFGSAKKKAAGVTDAIRKLMRRARNPLASAVRIIENYREIADWAMVGDFSERLAKDYTADVYRNNTTARTRMVQFFRDHGDLSRCNAAKPMMAIADLMDAAVVEDGVERLPELINSEFYERLCRWGYGMEKVFEECTEADHWRGDAKKLRTQWNLLGEYHPSDRMTAEIRAPAADGQVKDNMQQKAMFAKYLEKKRAIVT